MMEHWVKVMSTSDAFNQGHPGQECRWQKMIFASRHKALWLSTAVCPQASLLSRAWWSKCHTGWDLGSSTNWSPWRGSPAYPGNWSLMSNQADGSPNFQIFRLKWPDPFNAQKLDAHTWKYNLTNPKGKQPRIPRITRELGFFLYSTFFFSSRFIFLCLLLPTFFSLFYR